MKKTAFLFPGQGSQTVGMGLDVYQEYDVVRELFDMAEEISKINLSNLCFKGPKISPKPLIFSRRSPR